jgi:aerotaxis receptor
MKPSGHVTNVETVIPDDEFIFSQTDLKGRITEANPVFARISGYSIEEMLGEPHNLVRHPDMPKEAFADLWKSLKAGRPWRGIVKNRRKDGGFYWVVANVSPVRENGQLVGYQSLRLRPSRDEIRAAEAAYRRIRNGDQSLRIENGQALPVRSPWSERLRSTDTQLLLVAAAAVLSGAAGLGAELLPDVFVHSFLRFAALALFLAGIGAGLLASFRIIPQSRSHRTRLRDYIDSILSSGNLASPINLDFGSQSDEIGSRLLLLVNWVRTTMLCIKDAVQPVKDGTQEVLNAILDIEKSTRLQTASTSSVAAAAAELELTLREIAQHLKNAQQTVSDSGARASEGAGVSQRATEQINNLVETIKLAATEVEALSTSSAEVGEIASVIRSIAEQTNLLALNASIEAARAGEAGRGFAVVANEVRSLADRTREATEKIDALIVTIRGDSMRAVEGMKSGEAKVTEGVNLVQAAQDLLARINALMRDAVSNVSEIASASSQQTMAIGEISANIAGVASTTEQNAGLTQKTCAMIGNLSPLVDRVRKAVEQYSF